MIEAYLQFISENLDEAEELRNQYNRWMKIYKKRVFQMKWSKNITEILNILRKSIEEEIKECQYYVKRIKEIKDAKISSSQFGKNSEYAGSERGSSGDTTQDITSTKSEVMGSTCEETNDISC